MTSATFAVDGMHCTSCANKISTALDGLDGVSGVQVDLENSRVTVSATGASLDDAVIATITDLGYTAARA